MPESALVDSISSRGGALGSAARLRTLVAFCDRRQRERLGMRTARLYALGLGVSYSVLALLAAGFGPARALVLRELTAASWVVAGLAALSLSTDLKAQDAARGFEGLLVQRGIADDALGLGHFLAGAKRVAMLVALSALLVCATAALRVQSLASGLALLWLALAVTVYSALLGAAVSALARAAATLAPRHGRTLFVALVVLPHAARELWPGFPSVPAAFGALLSLVGRLGAAAP